MISLRRVVSQRLCAGVQPGQISPFATRRYNGDPGPQTSANRKSQRSRLREATFGDTGRGRGIDADVLSQILSAQPLLVSGDGSGRDSADREPREPRRYREPVSAGRDGGMRRDRPTRVYDPDNKRWKFVGREDQGDSGGRNSTSYGGNVSPDAPSSFGVGGGSSDRQSRQRYTVQHRDDQSGSPAGYRNSTSARNSDPSQRSKDDPFTTSTELRDLVKASGTPMSNAQIETAINIVTSARKSAVNIIVWNHLLGILGREGRLEKMWKMFNDMKKTGIRPSAHTYTSLLNSYAGVPHSSHPFSPTATNPAPPSGHLSRVSIIWTEAEKYVSNMSTASTGLDQMDPSLSTSPESPLAPTNAYLKFLSRYQMWNAMWKLFLEKQERGTSWDQLGYTTMFQALQGLARRQAGQPDKLNHVLVGPMARELWEDAVKTLEGKNADEGGLDNFLATFGVGALMHGRPEDQRFAMELIPTLWSLTPLPSVSPVIDQPTTSPADSGMETDSPAIRLPSLKIDVHTATNLLRSLTTASRPTLASHYATVLLSRPRLRREADPPFLYACATAFADTGDITAVLDLLQKHAHFPPQGGWRAGLWYDCLTAARWARLEGEGTGKGDWEGIKSVLGYMGILPKPNIQRAEAEDWKRKPSAPHTPYTVPLDAKSMTIILKTALGRNKAEVTEAVKILDKAGVEVVMKIYEQAMRLGEGSANSKKWEWSKELCKDMGRALEGLGEKDLRSCCGQATRDVVSRISTTKLSAIGGGDDISQGGQRYVAEDMGSRDASRSAWRAEDRGRGMRGSNRLERGSERMSQGPWRDEGKEKEGRVRREGENNGRIGRGSWRDERGSEANRSGLQLSWKR